MVRFWRIVSAVAIETCIRHQARRMEMDKALEKLNKEVGAESNKMRITGNRTEIILSVAFLFNAPQDLNLWKKVSRRELLYIPTENNTEVLNRVNEVLSMEHSSLELLDLLGITEREYRRSDEAPRITHSASNVVYMKTSPYYRGNEHVERVSDLEMEALFPELAEFDEEEEEEQEEQEATPESLLDLLKEALNDGTVRVAEVRT